VYIRELLKIIKNYKKNIMLTTTINFLVIAILLLVHYYSITLIKNKFNKKIKNIYHGK